MDSIGNGIGPLGIVQKFTISYFKLLFALHSI